MRILFTNTGSWGTGSFTVIEALTHEFLKMGHTVKIVFPDSGIKSKDKAHYYKNHELYDIWQFPIQKNNIRIPTFPFNDPRPSSQKS